MAKEGLTQRKKKTPAAEEAKGGEGRDAAVTAAAATHDKDKKDDDGLIYKDGKAYKKRKPTPDIWTMLSQGAPPETDSNGKPKPSAPARWYDNLLWPGLLFLTFLLSLFIFHNAPHDASKGRKMNRYTMDNLADGGFADGGKVKPEGTWGMPGSNNQRRDSGGTKDDEEDEKGEEN